MQKQHTRHHDMLERKQKKQTRRDCQIHELSRKRSQHAEITAPCKLHPTSAIKHWAIPQVSDKHTSATASPQKPHAMDLPRKCHKQHIPTPDKRVCLVTGSAPTSAKWPPRHVLNPAWSLLCVVAAIGRVCRACRARDATEVSGTCAQVWMGARREFRKLWLGLGRYPALEALLRPRKPAPEVPRRYGRARPNWI